MSDSMLIARARRTLTAASAFLLLGAPLLARAVSTGLTETANEADLPTTDIDTRITDIISVALSFVGVIFLCLMIYGGFLWMTAAGESDKVEDAKKIIRNAIIGLVLIFSAYAITQLAFQTVGSDSASDQQRCGEAGGTWIESDGPTGGSCI
jgi:hypothetical protein